MHTTLSLLNHALAATSPSKGSSGGGGSLGVLLIPILIIGVVYFLFMRPARNRQRAAAEQRRQVNVGDEITTTAGLIATVVAVDDDALTLEVAPGVHCRYVPAAVLRVNNEDDAAENDATGGDTPGDGLDPSTHEVIEPHEAIGAPETDTQPPVAADPPPAPPFATPVTDDSATSVDGPETKPETPGGTTQT